MDDDELTRFKDVQELYHVWSAHQALQNFRLASDHVYLLGVQTFLADDLECSCVDFAFSDFLGVLVLHDDDHAVAASAQQTSELEEFIEFDLLQVLKVLGIGLAKLFKMVR